LLYLSVGASSIHPFRGIALRFKNLDATTCVLAMLALLVAIPVQGQSPDPANSATLQGSVRDSDGRLIAGALVYLKTGNGTRTLNVRTDSTGAYRFSELRPATYSLRAEMAGHDSAASGPFVLAAQESKQIDLVLGSPKPSAAESPQLGTAEFFDQPQFTVAGVTDTTNAGGHGSDTILRTGDALAKAAVSLSTETSTSSKPDPSAAAAEKSLRETLQHDPDNFDANRRLGEVLVAQGKVGEALPFLARASALHPTDYETSYQLALAYASSGDYQRTRATARTLITQQDNADVHHLLGDVEEKLGDPLTAVREYQRAAELNPSEPNLFDWGAELLIHHAPEPAIEVFSEGNRLFPHSVRMLIGRGVAGYARGSYDQATKDVCQASDLNPDDLNPYLFLGRMQAVETVPADAVGQRLQRFVRLRPENALANYYYAVNLWQRRRDTQDTDTSMPVESLLRKAVDLDPKLAAGYLQLGILYSERKDLPQAISAYQKAIAANPRLAEAHYRLAQAYRQSGDKVKARNELQIHQQLSREAAEEAERERHEMQRFVYTLRDPSAGAEPTSRN
jgi:tetratricopeptide (TPR) repeat protein